MALSCHCHYEPECGDVLIDTPRDYEPLTTRRRRRCCSCNEPIHPGQLAVEFPRYKVPDCDYEWSRWGETAETGPRRASWYMCERCADLFYSLDELGYCINISYDMRDLAREYAELHSHKPVEAHPLQNQ